MIPAVHEFHLELVRAEYHQKHSFFKTECVHGADSTVSLCTITFIKSKNLRGVLKQEVELNNCKYNFVVYHNGSLRQPQVAICKNQPMQEDAIVLTLCPNSKTPTLVRLPTKATETNRLMSLLRKLKPIALLYYRNKKNFAGYESTDDDDFLCKRHALELQQRNYRKYKQRVYRVCSDIDAPLGIYDAIQKLLNCFEEECLYFDSKSRDTQGDDVASRQTIKQLCVVELLFHRHLLHSKLKIVVFS